MTKKSKIDITEKFQAKRQDADFDYFPPGTNPKEHTTGMGCHCKPFESMVDFEVIKDPSFVARAIIVIVQVNHRPIKKTWKSQPDIRMPDFGETTMGQVNAAQGIEMGHRNGRMLIPGAVYTDGTNGELVQ